LKVAVFFTWDYSLTTWHESGTITRELKFFKNIVKNKDVSFSFFTYGDSSDIKLASEHNLYEVHPIYSATKYFKNKLFRILSSFFIPFKIRNKIKNADIVFQNQLLGCWIPILIKKIYKKPLIIRTGYDMLDFAKKDKKSFLIIFLYKILTNFAVKNCDYFTVTSMNDLNRFKINYPKYKQKFLLRPNWVKVGPLSDFTNRYSNKVLAVGRLVNQKNFNFLISEFKKSKNNLEIDIVGSGPEKEKLLAQAKKHNVNINFLGNLNNNELLQLYQDYKFFISTSLFEGNPKSLLEAMGSGCVVFGTNINNHSEIITDNVNGFLFEIKDNHLLKKFELISKNDEILSKISKDAYKFINDVFSLNKSVDLFYSDFDKTLSR
jgi:glycosyltransferase involved in cell wall biosynthesis